MKKVARKALLTAKLYRPGKAGGGRSGYEDGGAPADPLADLAHLDLGPKPPKLPKLPKRQKDLSNFYSRGYEAANLLTQKKGTPQQMRAMLEKAGVKPEEFRWSGWDEKMAGKPSVTADEVAEHFYQNRPKLNTERRLSPDHDQYDPFSDDHAKFYDYTAYGGKNYREHLLTLPGKNPADESSDDYRQNPFREGMHWPQSRNVVAFTRMSDRNTPLNVRAAEAAYTKLKNNLSAFGVNDMRPLGAGAAEQAVATGILNEQEALDLSRMMHWQNKFTDNFKPERALYAEEIQSDWAQRGRKHGFLGPQSRQAKQDWQAKVDELAQRLDQSKRDLKLSTLKLMGISPDPETGDFDEGKLLGPEYSKYMTIRNRHPDLEPQRKALDQASVAYLDHTDKEPMHVPPEGPYVGSTPGWTNLVMKHLLTEAVRGGYDKLVISPGQMHADMYGFDEDDPRHAGMQNFYDNIIPKGLNKLVKGMDPDAEVQMHSHPLPGPTLNDGEGTYYGHALPITDKIRDAVNGGVPYFQQGGRVGYDTGGAPKRKVSARGLYSKGAEIARSLPMEKANGQQMIAMLADPKRGVKKEELVNAGLLTPEGKVHPDFARGTYTREQLAQHLEYHQPDIKETVNKKNPYPFTRSTDWEKAVNDALAAGDKDEAARIQNARMDMSIPPQYSEYTLPGLKNYREVLLHLPSRGEGEEGDYQSSHWHQPNVLAHLRMGDRTAPNGEKILHVQEIQSDWGQQGRDEGFRDEQEKRHASLVARRDALPAGPERENVQNMINQLGRETPGVPSGPHVGSTEGWTDLALKRVLHEAVKGGYDKVAIAPGQANADLFNLSRHFSGLAYDPEERMLSYKSKDGRWTDLPHDLEPEELPTHIGKDMTKKLLEQPRHPLSGNHILENLDHTVGGEGMRKFYDRDVPKRLNKLVQAYDPDAQVQMNALPMRAPDDAPEGTDQYMGHTLDITDKIRDAVNQGLPAFRRGGMAGEPDEEGKIYDPTDRDTNLGHFLHGSKVRNKSGDHVPVYHITPKSFSQFKPGGDDPTQSGPVIFLSPNREYLPAGHNTGGEKWGYKEGANVMPLWVNLRNPLMLDDYGKAREVMNRLKLNNAFPYFFTPEDRQALIDEGYDGVINGFSGLSGIPQVPYEPGKVGVGDQPHREEEIIAFHPNQVKSAIGNRGTYDRDEDDINKAEGGEVDDALENFYGPTAEEHRGRWYTGTSKDKDFTAFQESRHGTWLTRDPEVASQYAMHNDSQGYKRDDTYGAKPWALVKTNTASRVIPTFVRAENPYRGEKPEWVYNDNYKKAQSDWFDQLRSQGYDAWAPDSNKNLLVLLKNQGTHIKSAIGNSGAYDRSKKHLAKSEGGLIVDKAMALARSLTRR